MMSDRDRISGRSHLRLILVAPGFRLRSASADRRSLGGGGWPGPSAEVIVPELIEAIAILTCTLFAGAAIYVTAVEHPARLSCGTEIAFTQWAPSYKRGTVMQVSLAVTAAGAGMIRGLQGGSGAWALAAALIFAVIPFTIVVIFPTNTRLLEPGRDRRSAETRQLLESWGRLHAVRSALSLVAAIVFIWASVRS